MHSHHSILVMYERVSNKYSKHLCDSFIIEGLDVQAENDILIVYFSQRSWFGRIQT